MYALDSDLLIAFLGGNKEAVRALHELREESHVTALNAQEVLMGAHDEKTKARITTFLHAFPTIPYTINEVGDVVAIRQGLAKSGSPIGLIDEMIAGVARANGLTVVTRNRKHFSKIIGLKTKAW